MLMQLESSDHERSARLLVNSVQIQTFLVLVQEGSVTRSSQRLGLSHSTVSSHAKAMGDEFGQQLFERVRSGISVTPLGLDLYRALRPIMARLDLCLDHFVSRSPSPLQHVSVTLPAGFPGSPIDIVPDLAGWAGARKLQLSPAYAQGVDAGGLAIGLASSTEANASASIRDHWVLVRTETEPGWYAEPLDPAGLKGSRIVMPRLPDTLLAAANGLAEASGFDIEWSKLDIHDLVARDGHERGFAMLVPAGLLNPALVAQRFACTLIAPSAFDPQVVIHNAAGPEAEQELRHLLAELLSPAAIGAAIVNAPRSESVPERLSLKHCRSFIALYEEGNVRRAAERMHIVQPAMTVQLQRIEEQLGVTLFSRLHNGLQANEEADQLYSLLRPILTDLNAAVRAMRLTELPPAGQLRIGLIPALDDESLTAICFASGLQSWAGANAERPVQVVEGYSSTLMRWLGARKIDLALVDRVLPAEGVAFHQLAEDSMAVITNLSSGLLPDGPVALADVVDLPLVLPSSRHGLRTMMLEHLRAAGLTLRPRLEVDSMAAALSLVKIGGYATILPTGAVSRSRDRRHLSIHEIVAPRILRTTCLATRSEEHYDGSTLSLIADLKRAFAPVA